MLEMQLLWLPFGRCWFNAIHSRKCDFVQKWLHTVRVTFFCDNFRFFFEETKFLFRRRDNFILIFLKCILKNIFIFCGKSTCRRTQLQKKILWLNWKWKLTKKIHSVCIFNSVDYMGILDYVQRAINWFRPLRWLCVLSAMFIIWSVLHANNVVTGNVNTLHHSI